MMINVTNNSNNTVREFFDMWLKYYKYPNLKPTSYDVLKRVVRLYIYPSLGDKNLNQVTSLDIRKLLNNLQHHNYSHSIRKFMMH